MAAAAPTPITFVLAGTPQAQESATAVRGAAPPSPPAGLTRGKIKQSVRVGAQRGGASEVRMTAVPGKDVVAFHVVGGPVLVLHPENARDLLRAQAADGRDRGSRGARADRQGEIRIPPSLQWAGFEQVPAQRGEARALPGAVRLSAVEIVTDLGTDLAADFAASEFVRRVDAQVDAGVYGLSPDSLPRLKGTAAPLPQIPRGPNDDPVLVLVHGTMSETSGSFGRLWIDHPERVRSLFDHYRHRVYGLEHPTLGASPIDNALALARACPKGSRLHLLTHSRGGLVAETLARICAGPALTKNDLAFFKGDAYRTQRSALNTLSALAAERGLRVERVVRVACPSRGTLLASRRLDAYVSIFKWALELAGIPVAPAIVDFLGEVARRRADPALLPGLAAQIPDSPLVRWLNGAGTAIPGDLRVVAGDIEGDSVISWLKTLLADAFYWTDNDLVVQTRSMYGGAPRAPGATFLFDQGAKVSHFNYFRNERTAAAVADALTEEAPAGFRVIGPLSWSGASATGTRAVRRTRDLAPVGDKPAVFVLPGILGSNLKADGKRIWLSWRLIGGLERLGYTPGKADGVEPDGAIELTYGELEAFLATTHEVVEFAYDWRRPLEEEARRLGDAVEAALATRKRSGQPVRFVAHSMGGLLVRTLQLERPAVWQRTMAHPGARLLMLGTPNGGSWAPMQVLSGDDTFGNALVAVGAPFHDHAARQLMACFPGFIQLQAALADSKLALAREATWQRLADDDLAHVREFNAWHHDEIQLNAYTWGVPPQKVIDRAVALRARLDEQLRSDLDPFKRKLLLVVGKARFTPDGFALDDRGLEYLDAPETGDGRVTLESARIPGVRTWQVDCEHGELPARKDAFAAYGELLATGTTSLLAPLADAASTRAGAGASAPRVRSRPSHAPRPSVPPESARDIAAPEGRQPKPATAAGTALRISVINGDLLFVRQPLLLGHYTATRLTGTERVVDKLLDGAMSTALATGLYPDAPGSHQIFLNTGVNRENPLQLPRPEAAIVVGLGAEGKLLAADLVATVRQAVIAWSQHLTEMPGGAPGVFELASTLIGSGGIGISVGEAARLIAQGVHEANLRMAKGGWPVVSRLHLVELYLDRAGEVWRALQVQAAAAPGEFVVVEPVSSGPGALPRLLDSGYRGADYDLISAVTQEGRGGEAQIVYTLDTKRARSEVRAQATQTRLLRQLVTGVPQNALADAQLGRTLFKLLIPLEMEPFLGGTTDVQLELDGGTAGIPWEMLESDTSGDGSDPRPWAVRTKLLRKLRTADFRAQVSDSSADASVLVIGEPACDPDYPRLPGARDEALAVAERLSAALGAVRVQALISPDDPDELGADAQTVIGALLGRDWRVVHVAGHGALPETEGPPPKKGGDLPPDKGGGVVLSDGAFLGPREIRTMRKVPELVFVNCCHLAARDAAQLLIADGTDRAVPADRPRFAAGVAEELIKIGVRCVIAAGWAVDDDAAKAFATRFYDALVRGCRFIDAVAEARQAAWEKGGNTWAAYQCYGDPDWIFAPEAADAQRPRASFADEFAGIASSQGLLLALQSLAVKSKYQRVPAQEQQARIRHLEARFASRWGDIGAIAEAFGDAWDEAGDRAPAIAWLTRALGANDGTASLEAVTKLGNLRARRAWEAAAQAAQPSPIQRGPRKRGKAPTASRAATTRARDAAFRAARAEISGALALLEQLTNLRPSIERESLCGSAWKRMALLEALAKRPDAEAAAIVNMKLRYGNAEKLARAGNDPQLFYPALNRMAAELIVDAARRGWRGFDAAALAEVRRHLAAKARDDPDFWSVVGLTELRLYEAIARRRLAGELEAIVGEYRDLHARVSATTHWGSVLDQVRFVLPKYQMRATAGEKQAAIALTKYLEGLAGGAAAVQP
ncbi:MAG TPA: CHAT domain-containing protein [Casimicrobiaceae bacterium]|nr:CHAT domain-containing protein [Casimicrobiaceae bacterium]